MIRSSACQPQADTHPALWDEPWSSKLHHVLGHDPDFRKLGYIHGVLKRVLNVNNIRSLFHTEVLRAAGLINDSALADAEAKAKVRYVDNPGFGIEPEAADRQLQSVKSEYADEYKSVDDFKMPGA